jgi:hypothetical protein
MKKIDRTGQKFGKLTFIKRLENDKKYRWELRCDCGKILFAKSGDVVSGHTKSCGCILRETIAEIGRKKRIHTPIMSTVTTIWRHQRYNDGDITAENFYKLSQQNCYYCGSVPSNKATSKNGTPFIYNGLDRVDSSKTHMLNNVVTCCKQCNYAKLDYTQEEFLDMCRRVAEKHPKY